MLNKITGIVLAGGKSTRMGQNKSFLPFRGKMLIEHSINLMKRICDEVIVSANEEYFNTLGLPVIPDNFSSIGPLGGIEAALSYSKTINNLFIPADTPFLTPAIYFELIKYASQHSAVVPITQGNRPEPIIAYYSKELLSKIQFQIGEGQYKIKDLLQSVAYKGINIPYPGILNNLNTRSELDKASEASKPVLDNMILVCGNGRNVGKTTLSCSIIHRLSRFTMVTGIKVSPHFHDILVDQSVLTSNERFVIVEEKAISSKDSSLMLQAGAQRVYFIMCKQENLSEAITTLLKDLIGQAVVCESGGLAEIVQPGLSLFVKKYDHVISKYSCLNHGAIQVTNRQNSFDFDVKRIGYRDNQITLDLN